MLVILNQISDILLELSLMEESTFQYEEMNSRNHAILKMSPYTQRITDMRRYELGPNFTTRLKESIIF